MFVGRTKKRGARDGLKERREGGGVVGRERAKEYLSVRMREGWQEGQR